LPGLADTVIEASGAEAAAPANQDIRLVRYAMCKTVCGSGVTNWQ
jgi:hypothetical protein